MAADSILHLPNPQKIMVMKIGILTFHRAYNYGAVLQCYALQQVLKRLGFDVEVIDYRQPSVEKYYKIFRYDRFKKSLSSLSSFISFLAITKYNYKRSIPFNHFSKHLMISSKIYRSVDELLPYNAILVGSDQLLNTEITNGLDPWYSGKFRFLNTGSQKIAYAISADMPSIQQMDREQLIDIVNAFDSFSFRELTIAKEIEKKTGLVIATCLDPTLLTISSDWMGLVSDLPKTKKCVVAYEVRKPKQPKALTDKAKQYARRKGLKYVEISNPFMEVSDWLSYIKNAECVFTSSFHATAFSLIFGTPLISFKLDDGNDARYVDLLYKLGLENNVKSLCDEIQEVPDFCSNLEDKISSLRLPSLNYIKDALSKIK